MHLRGPVRQILVGLAALFLFGSRRNYLHLLLESYSAYPSSFTPSEWTFSIETAIGVIFGLLAGYQALPFMRHDDRVDDLSPYLVVIMLISGVAPWAPLWCNAVLGWALVVALYFAIEVANSHEAYVVIDHAYTYLIRLPISGLCAWALISAVLRTCQVLESYGISVGSEAAAVLILPIGFAHAALIIQSSSSVPALVSLWAFEGIICSNKNSPHLPPIFAATAFAFLTVVGAVILRLGGYLPKQFSHTKWGLSVALPPTSV